MSWNSDQTQFPLVTSSIPTAAQGPIQSSIQAKDITGTGTIAGRAGFNLGGPAGINLNGQQGIWAGAQSFAQAPFSVDLLGHVKATSGTFTGAITGSTISGSTITGSSLKAGLPGQIQATISTDPGGGYFSVTNVAGTEIGRITAGSVGGLFYTKISNSQSGSIAEVDVYSDQIAIVSGSTSINVNGTTNNINLFGNTSVFGNFSSSGTKAFDISHPTKKDMRLRYIAVESPEVLVTCRGKGAFTKSLLPTHFTDVSEANSIQVVQGTDPLNGGVSWVATGVRLGYANFVPEYPEPSTGQPSNESAQ